MSSFSVVLDACVLYPAALRDTLLRAADAGLYRLHWSEEILDEVGRNLVKNSVADELAAQRLLDHMRQAFPDAAVAGHECLVESMPNHPGDRHVVAAAVKANAQLIVTANLVLPIRASSGTAMPLPYHSCA
jgi:predicted nucleic acid-binding protein